MTVEHAAAKGTGPFTLVTLLDSSPRHTTSAPQQGASTAGVSNYGMAKLAAYIAEMLPPELWYTFHVSRTGKEGCRNTRFFFPERPCSGRDVTWAPPPAPPFMVRGLLVSVCCCWCCVFCCCDTGHLWFSLCAQVRPLFYSHALQRTALRVTFPHVLAQV